MSAQLVSFPHVCVISLLRESEMKNERPPPQSPPHVREGGALTVPGTSTRNKAPAHGHARSPSEQGSGPVTSSRACACRGGREVGAPTPSQAPRRAHPRRPPARHSAEQRPVQGWGASPGFQGPITQQLLPTVPMGEENAIGGCWALSSPGS